MSGAIPRDRRDFRAAAVVALGCVAPPLVHWLALGPQVPEASFFLLSRLSDIPTAADPSNQIYAFARPPVYDLLGWLLEFPLAFLVAGFLAHGWVNLLVFRLADRAIVTLLPRTPPRRRLALALAVVALVYPVALPMRLTGHATTLVPHDAYYFFSFRTLHVALTLWGYLALLQDRPRRALLVVAASCYVHPTAGILALGLLSAALWPALWRRGDRWLGPFWIGALALGAAPTLAKLWLVELPPVSGEVLSYGEWYSQLIKDEADDFSVLAQLVLMPKPLALIFAVIGAGLVLYGRLVPEFRRHASFWHLAAIPTLYVGAGVGELLLAVWWPTPFIHPLVALTIGYRLLSFAFFPGLVLLARLLAVAVQPVDRARPGGLAAWAAGRPVGAVTGLVLVSWVGLVGHGAVTGHLAAAVGYGRWAAGAGRVGGIDAYYRGLLASGDTRFDQSAVVDFAGGPVTYPGERNIFRIRRRDREQPVVVAIADAAARFGAPAFVALVTQIRAAVPPGAGLIVPPYLRQFRDALPSHAIFFQEHPDGNLMMGSPVFMSFWNTRMRDLLGVTYEGLPSTPSGLLAGAMRQAFLGLTETAVVRLHRSYPMYRYFITEREHALGFAVVCDSGPFVVYDLARPVATGGRPPARLATASGPPGR